MSKIKDQINKDKLLLYIWSNISELWIYSKFSLIVSVIILISTLIFYSDIAYWLFGNTDESKGKLLTLLLTIIGAIFAIYGLKINSKRIKQGNEQLKQQDKNNTNTRFKDAVTLLGNDNPAVVLGGIHTLNQIAINNIEYREIVFDILCSYVREKSDGLNFKLKTGRPSTVVQLIIDILFKENWEIYKSYKYNFKNTTFRYVTFQGDLIQNIKLDIDNCIFYECHFYSFKISNFVFKYVSFIGCSLYNIYLQNGYYIDSKIKNCRSNIKDYFENVEIANCKLEGNEINSLVLYNSAFKQTIITNNRINSGKIIGCRFHMFLFENNELSNMTFSNKDIDFMESFPNNKFYTCNNVKL